MGYLTDFEGTFEIDRSVDEETYKLLEGLASTRRMKRNIEGYGIDGEFYVEDGLPDTIVEYNTPPRTQPGLWCQWQISEEDKQTIEWDYGEKFYEYVEWLQYIIEKILEPRGYILNGEVYWSGEEMLDIGTLFVKDNSIYIMDSFKVSSPLPEPRYKAKQKPREEIITD